MGKVLDAIGEREEKFIASQKVFFVATAPLDPSHHVNVSPKAPGSSVAVIDPHTVAYADLSGSGSETAAHVLENERMTLLFCNLEAGLPKILRLHGKAQVVVKEKVDQALLERFPVKITSSYGFRCVYILKVDRISSSCGYSLPIFQFERHREVLNEYTEKEGAQGMIDYGIKKNSYSIDGLPSLSLLRHAGGDHRIIPKPENGYIFGEMVPKSDPRAQEQKVIISKSKSSVWDGGHHIVVMAFLAGILLGCFMTIGTELIPSEA